VTAYLVATSILTVLPQSERTLRMQRMAMPAAFVLAAGTFTAALISAAQGIIGFVIPLVIFGILALAAGVGDRRMLRAGGLRGAARLKRHLWRMCVALFVAAGSFFLGPTRRIPEPLRIPALKLLPFVALVAMAYWLWRYRGRRDSSNARGITASETV
jgi:hypothetical protein